MKHVILVVAIAFGLLIIINITESAPINKDTPCCEIVVERIQADEAIVNYISNTPEESYEIYIEVEYSEEWATTQALENLIEEQVNVMQEDCYHNHS